MSKALLKIKSASPTMHSEEKLVGFENAKGEMCYLFIEPQHFAGNDQIYVFIVSHDAGTAHVEFPVEGKVRYDIPLASLAISDAPTPTRSEDIDQQWFFGQAADQYGEGAALAKVVNTMDNRVMLQCHADGRDYEWDITDRFYQIMRWRREYRGV